MEPSYTQWCIGVCPRPAHRVPLPIRGLALASAGLRRSQCWLARGFSAASKVWYQALRGGPPQRRRPLRACVEAGR